MPKFDGGFAIGEEPLHAEELSIEDDFVFVREPDCGIVDLWRSLGYDELFTEKEDIVEEDNTDDYSGGPVFNTESKERRTHPR